MGKYRVTAGQNIYDVALHLYGSIEGIVDLMMNNRDLSLVTTLRAGDELVYTDDFIINADVVAYNTLHGIVPANGERHVYHKKITLPASAIFHLPAELTSVSCSLSGEGTVEIDWGDNSDVETVPLGKDVRTLAHIFDNKVRGKRTVRWFSDTRFGKADWSGLQPSSLFLLREFPVEELKLTGCALSLESFQLLTETYDLNLTGITTGSLMPLVRCKELMTLDLAEAHLRSTVIDAYLTALVEDYGNRRNCTVTLPTMPSGTYREPLRDEVSGRYILSSGMEALWVLLHEEAWNEGGVWKFIINGQTYTAENGTDNQGHI